MVLSPYSGTNQILNKTGRTSMQQERAKCRMVLSPYSGQSGYLFIPAHGDHNYPRIGGCAPLFAIVGEPSGYWGPTPTRACICIPTYNEREGPPPVNGGQLWWTR